jgi:nucleoside-diphosphate-sugar epimerase
MSSVDGSARGPGVLLTGATGFVGMELLARYLEHTEDHVYALVRAASDEQARARLQRTLMGLFGAEHPYSERVSGDASSVGELVEFALAADWGRRAIPRCAASRPMEPVDQATGRHASERIGVAR